MALNGRDYHRIIDFILGISVFLVLAIVIVVVVHENNRIKEENVILAHKYDSTLSKQIVKAMGMPQGDCTTRDCLIREDQYGLATIEGYFTEVEREGNACNGFVVTGGSEKFTKLSASYVSPPSLSFVSMNKAGQPIVNLNMDDFSDTEKDQMTNSSAKSLLHMIVLLPMNEIDDSQSCVTFMQVLKIN